jgi:RNA ligase (TIGR02306 family)
MIPSATVVRIDDVVDIPDAQHVQLVRIGDFQSVTDLGVYRPGDYAVFITDGCVLPLDLIEMLGATGKLSGRDGRTVRTRELCGYVSQGILIPVDSGDGCPFICLPTDDGIGAMYGVHEGQDLLDVLNISVPSHRTPSAPPPVFDFS